MLSLPIVSFIRNNWHLMVLAIVAIFIALWDPAYNIVGAFCYLPLLALGVIIGARFVIHCAFFKSIEAYTDQTTTKIRVWDDKLNAWIDQPIGNFTSDFHLLAPSTKCWMVIIVRVAFAIAVTLLVMRFWH